MREKQLEALFLKAFNIYYCDKEVYEDLALIYKIATDTEELESERSVILTQINQLTSEIQGLIKLLSANGESERFRNEYKKLEVEYNLHKERLDTLDSSIAERVNKRKLIEAFERRVDNIREPITEFSKEEFTALIEKILISQNKATFVFKNGVEIDVDIYK